MQGWFDGHPEIGKMQKDVFDDIFDTTDDDASEEDDPAPLVPTPTDFQVGGAGLRSFSAIPSTTNLDYEYHGHCT